MTNEGKEKADSMLKRLNLPPVSKCNIAKFYAPAVGVASYTALSINVMNPSLVVRIFPKRDVTNVLLGSALVGTGAYIYTRKHMKAAPGLPRVIYSTAGALLLSFGSVLLWAVLRSVVPPNPTLCTLAGVGSGLAIVKLGSSYLEFVDSQIATK